MTEPDVLGNISGAKFIWENGNTEVINLWSASDFGGTKSMHSPSATTENGADYQVPVSRVYYMLGLIKIWGYATDDNQILKNTTTDTTTGGTTLWRAFNTASDTSDPISRNFVNGYLKFVAGEFVVMDTFNGSDSFWNAWGVECDA